MPIVKTYGNSVKDRVAAIEQNETFSNQNLNQTISENSIIQAKYVSEVRGINRYRHFYKPNVMNDVNTITSFEKDSSSHLPFLIRPGQIHYIDPNDRDAENSMEKGARKKKKNVILPQLTNGNVKQSKFRKKDDVSQIEENTRIPMVKTSFESENSIKSNTSRRKLNDSLSNHNVNQINYCNRNTPNKMDDGLGSKRTFASLGQRQNGVIITRPVHNSLEVALPPRSKSAQDLEARIESQYELLTTPTYKIVSSSSSIRDFRDMATQTSKSVSTASVEFLNCVRSTQTDAVPIVIVPRRKSEVPVNLQDIEEREALMEVIEDALGETFDKYSRVRTNQIIANSARKQAQIWRDAKDFLANTLFPQAIQIANKSTTKRQTAAEIVANIKIYP